MPANAAPKLPFISSITRQWSNSTLDAKSGPFASFVALSIRSLHFRAELVGFSKSAACITIQ